MARRGVGQRGAEPPALPTLASLPHPSARGYLSPTAMPTSSLRPLAALVAGALAGALAGPVGCASRPSAAAPAAEAPQAAAPLAVLAGQRVVLVPSQRLREAGTLGWTAQVASPREYLTGLDDEIAAALLERGVGSNWVMPKDVVRSARRNPTYATDPYALAVNSLEPGRKAWLQVAKGEVSLGEDTLRAGDAAAITDQAEIAVRSNAPSEVLLFDLA